MAMQEPSLSKDSTIYNYKLVKRVHHSVYKIALYSLLLLLVCAHDMEHIAWWPMLAGYPLLLAGHALLVRIYFQYTVGGSMRGWTFRWGFFWSGILPAGNASIRLVCRVQLHLFWVGLALLGGLYPWIDASWLGYLLLFHIWMLLPRLWMLFRFRPFRKNGLIKISGRDTSCYTP